MLGLSKILRWGEGRAVKRLDKIAEQVMSEDERFTAMSDDELRGMTDELKQRIEDGEELDDLLIDAFATAREASWRVLGQKHYKVQIMGCLLYTSPSPRDS